MAKQPKREDDIVWKMLESEMGMPEVQEVAAYLRGDSDHYEMGYGDLYIEPYDSNGGRSAMFRVRHATFGETTLSHSALVSILHDLRHHLRKQFR